MYLEYCRWSFTLATFEQLGSPGQRAVKRVCVCVCSPVTKLHMVVQNAENGWFGAVRGLLRVSRNVTIR